MEKSLLTFAPCGKEVGHFSVQCIQNKNHVTNHPVNVISAISCSYFLKWGHYGVHSNALANATRSLIG